MRRDKPVKFVSRLPMNRGFAGNSGITCGFTRSSTSCGRLDVLECKVVEYHLSIAGAYGKEILVGTNAQLRDRGACRTCCDLLEEFKPLLKDADRNQRFWH